jgi:hypothetical protein
VGNFGKVRPLSPGKIGLKSFVHFQTVLMEGNFSKVRLLSLGKIGFKTIYPFPDCPRGGQIWQGEAVVTE